MFELLIVQPVFNVLIFIYALLPGHNFGLALILFTVFARLVMHPLVKKQLHHSKAMRELQPELKKIKEATKGDPQEASRLTMELYKEREVSPLSSLGVIAVQIVVLVGLYTGLRQVSDDPTVILDKAYGWLAGLGTLKDLAVDISKFDFTLFGLVDLSRPAGGPAGFYFPAFVLVIGSAVAQYFMGKQTLPDEGDKASLRKILRNRKANTAEEKADAQAVFGQMLKYAIPLAIFVFTYGLASALALYWMTAGVVGYYQQKSIFDQDEDELKKTAKSKKPSTKVKTS